MKRGTYVSRAVYTKLQMENQRLMSDLRLICVGLSFEGIQAKLKWQNHFKKQHDFNKQLRELLVRKKKPA